MKKRTLDSKKYACLALMAGLLFSFDALAASLVPHRAVYDVRLGRAGSDSPVANAFGRMLTSLEKSCDGWVIGQDMSLLLLTSEGQESRSLFRFSALESFDATQYRFSVRAAENGQIVDIQGGAQMSATGGRAQFSSPEKKTFALPANTLFPSAHTQQIIAAAQSGKRMISVSTFDGAEIEGAREVTAFIGKKFDASAMADAVAGQGQAALLAHPGWRVRMAYYAPDSHAPEPEYEIEVFQLDNGVVTRWELDYGVYSLIFDLKTLESMPDTNC